MKLTLIFLIFAAGAVTALSAGSIGNARVESSAGSGLDFCQQSASGTSIVIGCESFLGQVDASGSRATVASSFGNLFLTADAGSCCVSASASASASYDEFLLFGNTSMPITGEYSFSFDETFQGQLTFTIYQGDAVFQFNPYCYFNDCYPSRLFLTSNYWQMFQWRYRRLHPSLRALRGLNSQKLAVASSASRLRIH